MAVIKKFFFDGENVRAEKVTQKGKSKDIRKESAGKSIDAGKSPNVAKQVPAAEKNSSPNTDEISMLISSLLNKNGKRYARVSFLRGEDMAEGIVPDGEIEHVNGFSEEEVAGLKFYLEANKEDILAQAKQIDPLINWLRTPPGK